MFLKNLKSSYLLGIILCIITVTALYFPTIQRPWLYYDESIISHEVYYPQPSSFIEIFEFLKVFGLNHTLISSNTLYSSNYVTRSCPLDQFFGMLAALLFKQNPVAYHVFNLLLHLINTCLFYLILRTILKTNLSAIFLTLLWSLHPAMVEAVMLGTNWGALLSYGIFFLLLLDFLSDTKKDSLPKKILITLIFFITLLKNEQIISLPLVFFVISFAKEYQHKDFKTSAVSSIKQVLPYFSGLGLFLIFFFLLSNYQFVHSEQNSLIITVQRIFWLSPQIFFHFIKLILFPKTLSIDQSILVKLGKTIFDPYSILCIAFFSLFLLIPFFLFVKKKLYPNLFLLTWTFFFTLLPFLHILMPSYTLANERYLYCPFAMLLLSTAAFFPEKLSKKRSLTLVIFASFVIVACFTRSFYRTLDWKDNFSFINSTYKSSRHSLYKAIRLGMLGKVVSETEPNGKEKSKNYFKKTLSLLSNSRKEIELEKKNLKSKPPLVLSSYGLDYDALLAKIGYLEASSRCLELNEPVSSGLKILKPYIKYNTKVDANTFELYTHLLVLNNEYKKAKKILLKANQIHPHISFILITLYDMILQFEKNREEAEKYLQEALKYYPYDININAKAFVFYQGNKDPLVTAKYSYRYGLRIESDVAYIQALAIYLDKDHISDAKKVVQKLLQFKTQNINSLYLISKYYYKIKDLNKAIIFLQNAYFLAIKSSYEPSQTFDMGYTLAKLYLTAKLKDKAFLIYQSLGNFTANNQSNILRLSELQKLLGV